ncbi:MAG TPA: TonB-dependent receptor [Pyrinomonadaceae bacterium]|nr:TonB-dependent receptor [Pyrinomonadaceae bacterium]
MRSVLRLVSSGWLISFVLITLAFSQGAQTGGITGTITDPQGAVVAGATVLVIHERTGNTERTITTSEDGSFIATLLPPGLYRLEITSKNFKKATIKDVQVRINETTRQDMELEVGAVTESVVVQAAPSLINATSAVTGQPIDSVTLRQLPLAAPNFLFLLSLSSGTAGEPTDVRTAGRGTADVNVNGQRTSNNSIQLEGVNVNDFNLAHFDTVPLPNPNTIQEMKVATSLYDASSGSKGGGALALVLRSGSKDWHFDGYWQHRNDALNANEWFRNANGLKKRARLLQNVFGFSGSGPVPAAGGFWFFNYQGVRARNGLDPTGSSVSPIVQAFPTNADGTTTAALLAGAFGLTPAQIDPIAVNILNVKDTRYGGQFLVPRPGQTGCGAITGGATGTFNCVFSAIAPITDNQYMISYDRFWRDGKEKLSGRWFWDNGATAKPYGTDTTLAFPRADLQRNRFVSLSYTHVFSPTVVNELRAGYSRYISAFSPTDPVALGDIGAVRGNSAQFPGIYRVSVTGSFSLGTGVNDERGTVSNQYNLVNTLSWIKDQHSLRFGVEGVQYQLNRFNNFAVRGSLGFAATTGTGFAFTAFQNFLQGRVTSIQSAFGDPARNFIATDYAAFVQDDWRITPRLTMNLGLRWEGMSFGKDKLYRAGIYDFGLAAAGQNPFLFPEKVNLAGFVGTPGVKDCALNDCFDGDNFAPRIGFAWDVKGDQKTVVRAGYGIYYQRLSNQNILQNSLAAPFTVQPLSSTTTPVSFQLANPFAGSPPPSAIAAAYIPSATFFAGLRRTSGTGPLDPNDPNVAPIFVNSAGQACLNYGGTATNCSINLASFTTAPTTAYTPWTQQYNLTIQRELWWGWAIEFGYVGAKYKGGLGIYTPFIARLASPTNPITVTDTSGKVYTITTNTPANEELRHQILGLSRRRGARLSGNIGQGSYNSLQVTLSRRMTTGMYFQAAYTYSKNIDNVSGSLSTDELNATRNGQNGANLYNDQSDPKQNRAISDFDRPHRLVVSYAYDLPFGRGQRFLSGVDGVADKLLSNWAISGIVTYQSGLPFSVTDSTSGGAYAAALGTARFICNGAEAAYTQGSTAAIVANYLNPACFTTVPVVPFGTAGATGWGNSPRNAFRGPFQQNWDFSLMKRINVTERQALELRMDVFNLFNHPVFRIPSASTSVNVGSGSPTTFTRITETAVPARLIQFGLRYSY